MVVQPGGLLMGSHHQPSAGTLPRHDKRIPLNNGRIRDGEIANDRSQKIIRLREILFTIRADNSRRKTIRYVCDNEGYNDSQVQYWEPAKWIPKVYNLGQGLLKNLVRNHPRHYFGAGGYPVSEYCGDFFGLESQKEMTDMVHGRSAVEKPNGMVQAMKERDRRISIYDLRRCAPPIAEFGVWNGRSHP
ncbi:hypothetical protein FQA39_LY19314 [Lamprigera yunnana]|nr:hypothetical protein FQA39_LY19314 [Lamprigera yunnana]